MNGYARLSQVNAELVNNSTAHNARLQRLIEQVSRAIDNHLGRHFYALEAQTRYVSAGYPGESRLYLDFDLIPPATTVKTSLTAAGTYTYTLVDGTDYLGWKLHGQEHEPYIALDVGPFATQIGSWGYGHGREVQIIGTVGYSRELEATGETLTAAITTTTATSLTSSGGDIDAGEVIEIDDEQIYVSAEADNVLTIQRGVNGSTAATHLINAPIYRRRYPRDVELATVMEVIRTWREVGTGASGQVGGDMGYSFSATYPRIRDLLQPFSRKIGIA